MKTEVKVGDVKNFIDIEGLNEEDVIVRKQSWGSMVINENEEMTYVATISDTSVDMDQDCVYSKGCDIRKILKAPVVLWSHSHSSPPVGKIVGLNITENSIQAKVKMAPTTFGNELWTLIRGGYLKTNSIGFVIKKAVIKGNKDFSEFVNKTGIQVAETCNRIITEFVLVENSLCSIPSNENALIEAISTKSIHLEDKLSKELGLKVVEVIVKEEDYGELIELKPFPNEHAARQESPDKYIRFRRQNDKFGPGIDAIFGITSDGKVELQSIRFSADKYTVEEARKWLEAHGHKTNIEPASGKSSEAVIVKEEPVTPEVKPVETPVIVVEPKVEVPLIVKPDLAATEEVFKPVFRIIRAGDYIPTTEDVKAYKNGKVLTV